MSAYCDVLEEENAFEAAGTGVNDDIWLGKKDLRGIAEVYMSDGRVEHEGGDSASTEEVVHSEGGERMGARYIGLGSLHSTAPVQEEEVD